MLRPRQGNVREEHDFLVGIADVEVLDEINCATLCGLPIFERLILAKSVTLLVHVECLKAGTTCRR